MKRLMMNNKTMTLKEITDLLDVRHNDAMKTVAILAKEPEFGTATIISYPTPSALQPNAKINTYQLNKRQSLAVSARLNTVLLMRVIDRWQELELELKQALPDFTNPAIAARAWADEVEQKQILQEQVKLDAPKVAFAMAVRNMEGACSISDFAKTTGTGRNRLFEQLRGDSIMMPSNRPYQRFIDRGLFIVIEQVPYTDNKGKTHPSFKTMITGKGQVWLESKYRPEHILKKAFKAIKEK